MTTYTRKAAQTRSRRQAAGKYASKAQAAAFTQYLRVGRDGLTAEETQLMETHPTAGATFVRSREWSK